MRIIFDVEKVPMHGFHMLAEIYHPGCTWDLPITLVCHAPHGAAKWLSMMLRHANYFSLAQVTCTCGCP